MMPTWKNREMGDADLETHEDSDVRVDSDLEPQDADVDGDSDIDEPDVGCAFPHLLVSVENLEEGPGSVLRLAIGETLPFRSCPELTGRGGLTSSPTTLTWVPPYPGAPSGAVAVASWDGMYLVDASSDELLWRSPLEWMVDRLTPIDMVTIAGPNIVVGYAYDARLNIVQSLHIYDPLARTLAASVEPSSIMSLTASPLNESRLLALVYCYYDAIELDPWTGDLLQPPYEESIVGENPQTISSIHQGAESRTVWTGERSSAEHRYEYVLFHRRDVEGTGSLSGPIFCGDPPRNFVHALPDPTDPERFFALHSAEGGFPSLVRLSTANGLCETVLESTSGGTRFSRLALALP